MTNGFFQSTSDVSQSGRKKTKKQKVENDKQTEENPKRKGKSCL